MATVEDRLGDVEQGLGTLTKSVADMERVRGVDKLAAIKARNEHHGELLTELKRINGTLADHEKRIYGSELVDADRVRVTGELGIPNPAARRVSGRHVATGAGFIGVGSGLLYFIVELRGIIAELAAIVGSG